MAKAGFSAHTWIPGQQLSVPYMLMSQQASKAYISLYEVHPDGMADSACSTGRQARRSEAWAAIHYARG